MILEAIEVKHVGPFRREASIGPLKSGINVLAAANERGKTTFLRAAARALFDRHTCKDDEIRSLQPASSDLSPTIAVIFQSGGVRYRAEKRFLKNPESQFNEWRNGAWQLLAEGDDADKRLQTLLQSNVPGHGATKAAHWGLLGFLWARQGEVCEWPNWEGDTGRLIQTRLAKVELDPIINRLRETLWQDYTALFTEANGKPKKNGELERLETELQRLAQELSIVQQKRHEAEELQKRFADLAPEVGRLQVELQDRDTEAKRLQDEARQAEALQNDLQLRERELTVANEKLQAVSADLEKLQEHRNELVQTKYGLTEATTTQETAGKEETNAKERVAAAQRTFEMATAKLANLNAEKQHIADLQKLKQRESELASARQQLKKATTQAKAVRELKTEFDKLPNITPPKLKKLQELDRQIRDGETTLEALGLQIEVTADAGESIKVQHDEATEKITLRAGMMQKIRAVQSAELQFPGWGRLRIRSGATELKTLQKRLSEDRETFREKLVEIGVTSLADAEQKASRRKDLDKDFDSAQEKLQGFLEDFKSLEELEEHVAQIEFQTNAFLNSLAATNAERAKSATELDTESERLTVRVKDQQTTQAEASNDLKELRRIAEKKSETRENAEKAYVALAAKVSSLDEQTKSLLARYPRGIEKAKTDAQSSFVRAEAHRDEAQKKLPLDFDKLPERSRRATKAAEETRTEMERRRNEHNKLEGALQQAGAEGLHSKECNLVERNEFLQTQVNALRARGWAARLARDLIELRQQAATRSVLGPLEARLSGVFADITGDSDRRVFLDDQLQIVGVGNTRESVVQFTHLSQGAKEQLLLCLRLAVAGEVSVNGHKLVILDDVLVNTDGQRQERVLDVLRSAAEHFQILIATCHPERYRGIGEVVDIRTA